MTSRATPRVAALAFALALGVSAAHADPAHVGVWLALSSAHVDRAAHEQVRLARVIPATHDVDATLALAVARATKAAGRLYGLGGIGPLVHVDIAPRALILGVRFGAPPPNDRR